MKLPLPAVALHACVGRRVRRLALRDRLPSRPAQGVVKCIDANGNITYQDAPCTAGQAGRTMELAAAEAREDTGAWEAAAKDARVVKGMPKRWVLRARGAPAEIRPANAAKTPPKSGAMPPRTA